MEGEGGLVDGSVVDVDELVGAGEEVGAGDADPSVFGEGGSVGVVVVGEGQVEFVEEEAGSSLGVVVVDSEEGDCWAVLAVGGLEEGGFGSAGQTP